jgi:phage terminase large subunit GpA-like protein
MPTLADLQTERDALRAARAKREYEHELAQTLDMAALLQDGLACRHVIRAGLAGLAGTLAEAVAGESNETRIHYLLSETSQAWLREVGEACASVAQSAHGFGHKLQRAMAPRGLLSVSQWADRNRTLVSGTNSPGPWETAKTPYLREIMDALSEHSPVSRVVFIKSVQVGATEVLYNWLGYIMHHLHNKDVLVVVPTKDYRNQKFNPRLSRAIAETEVLRELVETGERARRNSEDILEYGVGAKIVKAGANVSTDLRSDPFPYIACDEIDEFPEEIPGSGDPMTLIEGRQTTFSRAKTFLVSTPKLEHSSRIAAEYAKSDRRRYHVPCPHCGEYQPLVWGHLKWRAVEIEGQAGVPESERLRRVETVWYECAHCHASIDETEKPDMLARGRWVAERPQVTAVRGYHINSLYAAPGLGRDWKWLAQKWLDVQHNTAELQAFVNERLGEPWRDEGDSIEDIALIARRETYPERLPSGFVVAGVDIQRDRIEASIVHVGAGEELWLLDHLILPGDTAQPDVWNDLHDALTAVHVRHAAIDAGYNTTLVYEFVKSRRWCTAIKGVSGLGRPLIEDERRRRQRLRVRNKRGVAVEPLGVDQGKLIIYSRLKLASPCAGYIHFPVSPAFDDEYFAQLAAEKLVSRMRAGRRVQEWQQTRPRNEALDCLVYALAAARLSGIDPASMAAPRISPAPARPASPAHVPIAKPAWSKHL